jgi:hypothetical protein
MMDEDAERRRRVRESLAQPGPVLRTNVIEPMRIASGGYRSNGVSASGSNGMTDERAMGMFADRSGMNAAARAGLNVGGGNRPKEIIDPSMALRIKNDMIQKEAGKRYGTLMEDTGPWAGSVSNAYLQYKSSNMMNSGADRRAAQAELARRSAREAQTEQIAGNIGVAAEQAKGLAAAGQVKLDVADRNAQARENAAAITGAAGVKKEEIKGQTSTEIAAAQEQTKLEIAGMGVEKANQDRLMKKTLGELDAETEKAIAQLNVEGKARYAEILSKYRNKIDPMTFMMATPEQRELLIKSLAAKETPGEGPLSAAVATVTPATGAGTAAAANAPAGGSALDANLPVYTPEQAKNLKPGFASRAVMEKSGRRNYFSNTAMPA